MVLVEAGAGGTSPGRGGPWPGVSPTRGARREGGSVRLWGCWDGLGSSPTTSRERWEPGGARRRGAVVAWAEREGPPALGTPIVTGASSAWGPLCQGNPLSRDPLCSGSPPPGDTPAQGTPTWGLLVRGCPPTHGRLLPRGLGTPPSWGNPCLRTTPPCLGTSLAAWRPSLPGDPLPRRGPRRTPPWVPPARRPPPRAVPTRSPPSTHPTSERGPFGLGVPRAWGVGVGVCVMWGGCSGGPRYPLALFLSL